MLSLGFRGRVSAQQVPSGNAPAGAALVVGDTRLFFLILAQEQAVVFSPHVPPACGGIHPPAAAVQKPHPGQQPRRPPARRHGARPSLRSPADAGDCGFWIGSNVRCAPRLQLGRAVPDAQDRDVSVKKGSLSRILTGKPLCAVRIAVACRERSLDGGLIGKPFYIAPDGRPDRPERQGLGQPPGKV